MNVAVVGATGQVGAVMLQMLAERSFPLDQLRVFASERSAGRTLIWQDRSVVVEDAATADWSGIDVALFSYITIISQCIGRWQYNYTSRTH